MAEQLFEGYTAFTGSVTVDCIAPRDRYLNGGNHIHGGKEPMTPEYAELARMAIEAELLGEPSDIEVHAGGGATNAAIFAAIMGLNPMLTAVIGDHNCESQAIRHDLRDIDGLDFDAVAVSGFVPRVSMLIQASQPNKTQPNRIWYRTDQPKFGEELEARYLRRFGLAVQAARLAYLGSVQAHLVRDVINVVPSEVPVALNPISTFFNRNVWPDGPGEIRKIIMDGLLKKGILCLNDDEICDAWGLECNLENARTAARHASQYVGHVLVTRGRQGALSIQAINGDDAIHKCDEAEVSNADFRNNGGAGDATAIGYVKAILEGADEDDALEEGRVYGAMACKSIGAHVHPHQLALVS